MAYLPADRTQPGREFEVDVRGRRARAQRRADAFLQATEVASVGLSISNPALRAEYLEKSIENQISPQGRSGHVST